MLLVFRTLSANSSSLNMGLCMCWCSAKTINMHLFLVWWICANRLCMPCHFNFQASCTLRHRSNPCTRWVLNQQWIDIRICIITSTCIKYQVLGGHAVDESKQSTPFEPRSLSSGQGQTCFQNVCSFCECQLTYLYDNFLSGNWTLNSMEILPLRI